MRIIRPLLLSLLCLTTPLYAVYGQDQAHEEFLKGNEAFEKLDYQTALTHYDRSLALDSSNASAYLKRGQVYWFSLLHEQAVRDLTRALERDADLTWAYYFRGISLLNLHRFEEGMEDLTKVIGPDVLPIDFRVRALHFRAIGYMNLERYEEAVADIAMCIELDPHQPLYRFERGALHEAMGHAEAAISDYEAFLATHPPDTPHTENVRQKLAALREGLN